MRTKKKIPRARRSEQLILETPEEEKKFTAGIISEAPPWKLIWELNRALSVDLAYSTDEEFNGFDAYAYEPAPDAWKIQAVVNKSGRKYFSPEAKMFTHILLVSGEPDVFSPEDALKKIKAIPCVQFASVINFKEE